MASGFISYSHRDHDLCSALREHLSAIERAHNIKFWWDRRISAGREWSGDIESAIKSADIFVYLMSPAFFDSEYIMGTEIPAISAKFDVNKHLNIPILARECCWEWEFGGFQAIPHDKRGNLRAVDLWKPRNSGWAEVLRSMKFSVEQHFNLKSSAHEKWRKSL